MFFMAIMRYKPHLFYKNKPNLIAQEESDRIHKKYKLFYDNRLSVINKSTVNQSFKHNYDFSFKPEINENSRALLENTSSELSKTDDRLVEKSLLEIKKKEKGIEEYIKNKEVECTFKPQTFSKFLKGSNVKETNKDTIAKEYIAIVNENSDRNEALYSLAFIAKEKSKLNTSENDKSLKELNDCTFSPKVIDKPRDCGSPRIFGSDKAIQRLSKAREEKELIKVISEKGFPYQGEKNLPRLDNEVKGITVKTPEIKKNDPEKEKRIKEWEIKKLRELKIQKDKEKSRQELLEKQKNEEKLQKTIELEEKRKKRIEKIQKSEGKKIKEKKREYKASKTFFSHVNKVEKGLNVLKVEEGLESKSILEIDLEAKSENFENFEAKLNQDTVDNKTIEESVSKSSDLHEKFIRNKEGEGSNEENSKKIRVDNDSVEENKFDKEKIEEIKDSKLEENVAKTCEVEKNKSDHINIGLIDNSTKESDNR